MNIEGADLNLLQVFLAIHAEGSVSRAAERLGVSQPTVSHALAKLRATYRDPLFVRARRRRDADRAREPARRGGPAGARPARGGRRRRRPLRAVALRAHVPPVPDRHRRDGVPAAADGGAREGGAARAHRGVPDRPDRPRARARQRPARPRARLHPVARRAAHGAVARALRRRDAARPSAGEAAADRVGARRSSSTRWCARIRRRRARCTISGSPTASGCRSRTSWCCRASSRRPTSRS